MSVVPNPAAMAECLNFGLGLSDNNDLPQSMMQARPMFRDVILKYMDFNSPSENEKEVLSGSSENIKQSPSNSTNNVLNSLSECENKLAEYSLDDLYSTEEDTTDHELDKPSVPSLDSALYYLPLNYNKRNPWRRTIGFHIYGHELRSATYPARSSVKKLRFAQAKKPLNYLYSYFSVELLDCDDRSSITIGICRKDYPSKVAAGKNSGSVGYNSDFGDVFIRDNIIIEGPSFSKGDIVGCGIIYPPHYKRYADLSTDDNSDGMTDVVLTSIANTNTKSMDFVCSVLNLNKKEINEKNEAASTLLMADEDNCGTEDSDCFNENFVESRTQVEVYFTHNMQVVGKVLSHVPVGGFYPTIHIFSCSAIKMKVDLNPPFS